MSRNRYRPPFPPAVRGNGTQKGIALITAVLITALVAILAVTMISEQQLDIRRTGNILDRAQAWQYALGMETIARLALRKDAENNKSDHRMEEWNKPVQFPAPEGAEGDMIGGRIEDLQGRFNLNNLVDGKGNIDVQQLQQFRRLLVLLDLPPGLADRVADWIDAGSMPHGLDGAEDDEYTRLEPSYRTANSYLVSPSELLLILSAEEYRKLADFVAVLPARKKTKINVNTAPKEVLASLEHVSSAEIDELLRQREQLEKQNKRGFDKIDEVLDLPAFQALKSQHRDFENYFKRCCGVTSRFFLVTVFAQFDKGEVTMRSVVERIASKDKKRFEVKTVLRTQGDY